MNGLYRVEVVHRLLVVASSEAEAEEWVERNSRSWTSDSAVEVVATPVKERVEVSDEERFVLPWVGGEISDEELDQTIEWWMERVPPEGENRADVRVPLSDMREELRGGEKDLRPSARKVRDRGL